MNQPTPNINSSRLLRAIRDILWEWEQEEEDSHLKKRQINAWIEAQENEGALWDEELRPMLERLQEWLLSDTCTRCGELTHGGDGYDGLCGNCADREAAKEEKDAHVSTGV